MSIEYQTFVPIFRNSKHLKRARDFFVTYLFLSSSNAMNCQSFWHFCSHRCDCLYFSSLMILLPMPKAIIEWRNMRGFAHIDTDKNHLFDFSFFFVFVFSVYFFSRRITSLHVFWLKTLTEIVITSAKLSIFLGRISCSSLFCLIVTHWMMAISVTVGDVETGTRKKVKINKNKKTKLITSAIRNE